MALTQTLLAGREVFHTVATIPICERDAKLFLTRLLENLTALGVGVAWYCDNLSNKSLERIFDFNGTVGLVVENDPHVKYSESYRQYPNDLAVKAGAEWMLRIDADETVVVEDWHCVRSLMDCGRIQWRFPWYNVWVDSHPHPVLRVDPPLEPQRCTRIALMPTRGVRWWYRHPVASGYSDVEVPEQKCSVRILHWGFSTPELRKDHKERWDRLYKPNPYGFWNDICDETKTPKLATFDPALTHEQFIEAL